LLFGSRARLVVVAISFAMLTAPVTGCQPSSVRVRLRAFANGDIDGLWFWQNVDGTYKRACRFDFSNVYKSGGREVVDYQQSCVNGAKGAPWQATVERNTSDWATVDLVLTYRPVGGGKKRAHRASAFNRSGESGLSSQSIML